MPWASGCAHPPSVAVFLIPIVERPVKIGLRMVTLNIRRKT